MVMYYNQKEGSGAIENPVPQNDRFVIFKPSMKELKAKIRYFFLNDIILQSTLKMNVEDERCQ